MLRLIQLTLTCALLNGIVAAGSPKPPPKNAIVVLNLTEEAKKANLGNRSIVIADSSTCTKLLTWKEGSPPSPDLDKALTDELVGHADTRFLGTVEDTVTVYVVYDSADDSVPTVEWNEVSRKSEFESGLASLGKLIKGFGLATSKAVTARKVHIETYSLTKVRAKLGVKASYAGNEEKGDLVTGPTEHWYISADLPVNKASELKFDSDSGTLQPKETPKELMFGVNFMFGDVLAETTPWHKRFVVKGMLKISKKPLDSVGAAVGYRFGGRVVSIIKSFSPFVGYIWTKEDEITNGVASANSHYVGEIRYGISFNIDAAVEWFKKD